jgi:hypothetical protein
MRIIMALFDMSSNMVAVMTMSEAHRFRLVRRVMEFVGLNRDVDLMLDAKFVSAQSGFAVYPSVVWGELDGNLSKHAVYLSGIYYIY